METQTTYVSQLGKNQALDFAEANLDSVWWNCLKKFKPSCKEKLFSFPP